MLYTYLKKIPEIEFIDWEKKFYENHKEDFPQHTREDFDSTFNAWVFNLIDDDSGNQTKIIKHYHLTLSVRDFLHTTLREDRDRLVDTYPEAFI
jgi:hypothetical protein